MEHSDSTADFALYPNLNKGKPVVNLVLMRTTPNPDRLVAVAARRCYSSRSADVIEDKISEAEIARLLDFLRQRNHLSPFEHADFSFSVDGISRALSHQLVRHRIASYSQESQRYVNYMKVDTLPFVTPPSIAAKPEALETYNKAIEQTLAAYRAMVEAGVPPEDARYIFPNAIETKLVFTMNARSLFNFFEQRCCIKAQWEIRALAMAMLKEVRKVAPNIFKNAGAPCQYASNPYCRENDPKCVMFKAMKERLYENEQTRGTEEINR
ncbi:MAG: thymidylate synthase [Clostridiales bacterium]|nr:thymidylate synthase [Clostridiales bacterium]MDN5283231.1 thymidylate synthase [Candidatus Ozemobacter sp.]